MFFDIEENVRCHFCFHFPLKLLILILQFELANIGIIHFEPSSSPDIKVIQIMSTLYVFTNMKNNPSQTVPHKLSFYRLCWQLFMASTIPKWKSIEVNHKYSRCWLYRCHVQKVSASTLLTPIILNLLNMLLPQRWLVRNCVNELLFRCVYRMRTVLTLKLAVYIYSEHPIKLI